MSDFNYEKAFCTQVVPAFETLSNHARDAHSRARALVGELNQGKDLNIPMTPAIRETLEALSTQELAELARVSYFAGHWRPTLLPALFETKRGESWKISNCIDQILRQRLSPPRCIQIHEGKFRVTFSSRDCWLWEEFGLATEKNLEIFKACGLPFGEYTLDSSAEELKRQIGDLWGDPEEEADNDLYKHLQALKLEQARQNVQSQYKNRIAKLAELQAAAQKEKEFLLECNRRGVIDISNVIYYSRTDTFCFGWREELSAEEAEALQAKLAGVPYRIEFKVRKART